MFAPASARKLLVVKNLPALISVTSGRPASSSFRSTQKTPVARSSTARTACEAISLTSARCGRATEGLELWPLGIRCPKTYSSRSLAADVTSSPSFQML